MVHVDPIVHAVPPEDRPDLADEAWQHAYEEAYEAWDMLAGKRHPELGGAPEILDVVGVNVYHFSQAQMNADRSREVLGPRDPRRKPLGELLLFAWERYHRPIIIGETSGYQDKRAEWLTMTMEESLRALNSGVDLQGVCLYPCVDIPDWNSGEMAQIGIYDLKDTEACERFPCDAYIEELRRWQQILDHPQQVEPDALRARRAGDGAAVRGAPPRPGVGGADPGPADGGRPVTAPAAAAALPAPAPAPGSWPAPSTPGRSGAGRPDFEQELHFHQLELTGHAEQLEGDYRLLREEFGLRRFRDGAWLARSLPAPGQFDWTYLDRLADVSRGEVTLSLCHYEWPPWIEPADLWNGRVLEVMAEFAGQVARRYRGRFGGLHPGGGERVLDGDDDRLGALVAGRPRTVTGRARRARPDGAPSAWWHLYAVVGRMLVAMARAVKEGDPRAQIALSEPWAWHPHVSLEDQGRPFNTLLGRPDPVAARERPAATTGAATPRCCRWWASTSTTTGASTTAGPSPACSSRPGATTREQRIDHGRDRQLPLLRLPHRRRLARPDRRGGAAGQRQGAAVEAVTWAPVLTLGDFDWGRPAPGAWVTWDADDPRRQRHWDPDVARAVRAYTARHRPRARS